MNIKMVIPGLLTLTNLFAGSIAIVICFNGHLEKIYILMAIALVSDFFDGFTARLMRSASPIGKDLDSLADCVSFCLLPACIIYKMIALYGSTTPAGDCLFPSGYFSLFPFIIVLFGALRLAKFNNDGDKQRYQFIGLPTPAMALFVLGYYFLCTNTNLRPFLIAWPTVLFICVFISMIMVAPIAIISFKLTTLRWNGNEFRYILIFISIVLIVILGKQSLAIIILCYIILSLIKNLSEKGHEKLKNETGIF